MILLILAIVTVDSRLQYFENLSESCTVYELHVVWGGECCNGYHDALGDWHDPHWCDDYCCGNSLLKLSCCDREFLQASSDDRSDFCELWWKNNVWAPILTALVSLGILIGCCVCCYKCCCASKNTTVVVQSPGMGPGGPVISNTVVSAQNNVNNSFSRPGQY